MAFPSGPSNGQTYTQAGTTYVYDSTYGVWNVNVTTVNADTLDGLDSSAFIQGGGGGTPTLSGLTVTGTTTLVTTNINGNATVGSSYTITSNKFRGRLDATSGDGQTNSPFHLETDFNSYMVATANDPATWGLFWAGSAGARYGTNGTGGPGNIWSNSGNPNELVFVGNDLTAWTVYGNTGDTWQRGSLIAVGNITAGGDVITNSDERLKSNIRPIENALDIVCSLNGKIYTKDGKDDQIGLIAQDVAKVLPQMVHTAQDEMETKSVNYQNMVALLIESVKELRAEVAELKGKLNGV